MKYELSIAIPVKISALIRGKQIKIWMSYGFEMIVLMFVLAQRNLVSPFGGTGPSSCRLKTQERKWLSKELLVLFRGKDTVESQ